jgi:hypothetical protein
MEADAHFQSLNISFRVPLKEPSLQDPFMESLRERCPIARAPASYSIQSPQFMNLPPDFRFSAAKGSLWRLPYPKTFFN